VTPGRHCNGADSPTVTADPDADAPDTPNTPNTPSDDPNDPGDGGCFSRTANKAMPEKSCVQSGQASSYGVWMQCMDGAWYRGGDGKTGRYGKCEGSLPL